MEKLKGSFLLDTVSNDNSEIWFAIKVKNNTILGIKESFFDCRIAKDNFFDEKLFCPTFDKLNCNDPVEVEGYMMVDEDEEDCMMMWFSVFKMTVNGEVIYNSPDVSLKVMQ